MLRTLKKRKKKGKGKKRKNIFVSPSRYTIFPFILSIYRDPFVVYVREYVCIDDRTLIYTFHRI